MGIVSQTAPAHDTAQQPDHDYRAMAAFGRRSTIRLNSSRAVAAAVAGSVAAAYLAGGRSWQLRWGATGEEARAALPGDDLIPAPDLTATRAITIHVPAVLIWPWIAQLGQGRGGFYTYDWLENLLGLDMRSADHVVSEWQDIRAGDQIRLAADVGLAVAIAEQGRALVIRGGIPMSPVPCPYDFTWGWILREAQDGTTRLVVRETICLHASMGAVPPRASSAHQLLDDPADAARDQGTRREQCLSTAPPKAGPRHDGPACQGRV